MNKKLFDCFEYSRNYKQISKQRTYVGFSHTKKMKHVTLIHTTGKTDLQKHVKNLLALKLSIYY